MAQTVIGFFDSAAEAQQAVQQLTSRGFSRDTIDVSSRGADTSSTSYTDSDTDHEESGIGRFFKNLFSDDDDERDKYTRVARNSGSIVTVHAQTSDQAEDAADILDDAGAFDVDERAAKYGYTGSGSSSTYGSTGTTGSSSVLGTDTTSTTSALSGADSAYGTTGAASPIGGYDTGNLGSAGTTSGTFGTSNTNDTTGTTGLSSDYDRTSEGTQKIPIIEENLQVGKREVATGGKRLRSRIIERPVEESLRLREESVTVNRTPVDRPASSADLSNFQGTEIEMTETKEVPVVSKEARVVEEVSLGKEVEQRNETISDTVRKTEVDIENIESKDTTSSDTTRSGSTSSDYNNLSDKNTF